MPLQEAISEANEIASRLNGRKINDNVRSKVCAACFAISQQHHNSILILLSRTPRLEATAFALLRLLVESVIRGEWLLHIATDQQIKDYVNSGTKLDMASMFTSLDKLTGLNSEQQIYRKCWGYLSSYTHTGELQVQRWLQSNNIEPTYTKDEISELIKLSSLVARMASQSVIQISTEV